MMETQLHNEMPDINSKVVTILQKVLETCSQATPATSAENGTSTITTQQANAVVTDNVQLEMLKLLQKIRRNMENNNNTTTDQYRIGNRTTNLVYTTRRNK